MDNRISGSMIRASDRICSMARYTEYLQKKMMKNLRLYNKERELIGSVNLGLHQTSKSTRLIQKKPLLILRRNYLKKTRRLFRGIQPRRVIKLSIDDVYKSGLKSQIKINSQMMVHAKIMLNLCPKDPIRILLVSLQQELLANQRMLQSNQVKIQQMSSKKNEQ